jgi:pyruvate/2-oxoglutarate dehydrogenase complex dihydrolipoamide acyltransferase (E2) component
MNNMTGPFHMVNLTPWRRVWLNILDLPRPTQSMYGLLEVDVTNARKSIAEYKKRTGETLSFTGFLAHCLACAVDENKQVQAYPKGHKQLMVFDDVNIGLMIEQQVGERRTLTGHVIKSANHKTYLEIHHEIRQVQITPVSTSSLMPSWFLAVLTLPWPFSKPVKAVLSMITRRNPTFPVAMQGTVGITAVGMFGKGHSGWGLEATRHSLDLVVGSIAWKPVVIEGRIEQREILNLTVVFDHYVIDGAPAARFTQRLVELIENGHGMDEIDKDN